MSALRAVRLDWKKDASGGWRTEQVAGSELEVPADLVLLAMGYLHPVKAGMLEQLGVTLGPGGGCLFDGEVGFAAVMRGYARPSF